MMIGPEQEPTVGQNGHDAIFKLLSVQALMLQIFLKVSVHPELLNFATANTKKLSMK